MMGLVCAIRFTIIEREREKNSAGDFCFVSTELNLLKADSNSAGERNQNNLSIAKHQELKSFLEQPRLH